MHLLRHLLRVLACEAAASKLFQAAKKRGMPGPCGPVAAGLCLRMLETS